MLEVMVKRMQRQRLKPIPRQRGKQRLKPRQKLMRKGTEKH